MSIHPYEMIRRFEDDHMIEYDFLIRKFDNDYKIQYDFHYINPARWLLKNWPSFKIEDVEEHLQDQLIKECSCICKVPIEKINEEVLIHYIEISRLDNKCWHHIPKKLGVCLTEKSIKVLIRHFPTYFNNVKDSINIKMLENISKEVRINYTNLVSQKMKKKVTKEILINILKIDGTQIENMKINQIITDELVNIAKLTYKEASKEDLSLYDFEKFRIHKIKPQLVTKFVILNKIRAGLIDRDVQFILGKYHTLIDEEICFAVAKFENRSFWKFFKAYKGANSELLERITQKYDVLEYFPSRILDLTINSENCYRYVFKWFDKNVIYNLLKLNRENYSKLVRFLGFEKSKFKKSDVEIDFEIAILIYKSGGGAKCFDEKVLIKEIVSRGEAYHIFEFCSMKLSYDTNFVFEILKLNPPLSGIKLSDEIEWEMDETPKRSDALEREINELKQFFVFRDPQYVIYLLYREPFRDYHIKYMIISISRNERMFFQLFEFLHSRFNYENGYPFDGEFYKFTYNRNLNINTLDKSFYLKRDCDTTYLISLMLKTASKFVNGCKVSSRNVEFKNASLFQTMNLGVYDFWNFGKDNVGVDILFNYSSEKMVYQFEKKRKSDFEIPFKLKKQKF